ncbi:MAG: flagellar motor protein MotB [Fidelibacterota bacterium]
MPRKPEPPPPEQGLPNWFATFADMMTLLLAFFVLLAAISTIDPVKLQAMADSMKKSVGKKREIKGAMSLADIEKAVKVMVEQEQMKEAVEVSTSTKGVTIGISSDISFESGSADLKPEIAPILEKIVPTIQESYFQVAVEGHTDNIPISDNIRERFPSNWELSGARAASVVRELINLGVDPTRLQAVGYAEYIPRNRPTDRLITQELIRELNATPELQARNRRVEITFLAPRGGPVGAHTEIPEEGEK